MRAPTALIALSSVLLVQSCTTHTDVLETAASYRESGDFFKAYLLLDDARRANPDDQRLGSAYWTARCEYLVDRGRDLVFQEDMIEAVGALEAALAIDPDHEGAKHWLLRAKEKLAKEAVRDANELRATGSTDGAFALYNQAVAYVPGQPEAEEGLAKVREEYDKKLQLAQQQYRDGMRSQADQRFEQTRYHLTESLQNDPTNPLARERRDSVALRLAERRFVLANKLEETAHYGAALQEYLTIAETMPDLPGLQDKVAQMRKEVEAERLVRDGESAVFRGDYPGARAKLEKAYELSVGERKAVSERLVLLKEREQATNYAAARDLDIEHHYEDALKKFKEIERAWPAYRDVKTRISGLEAAIDIATKAAERGEAAEKQGDSKAAIEAYQEALLAYPGFRDLDKRVKELRVKS